MASGDRRLLGTLLAVTLLAGGARWLLHPVIATPPSAALEWEEPGEIPRAPFGRKTLVLLTAEWCPECRILEETALQDEEFLGYVERERPRLIRLREENLGRFRFLRVLERFEVAGIPAFVVMGSSGKRAAPLLGAVPPKELVHELRWRFEWLDRSIRWRAWQDAGSRVEGGPALILFDEARYVPRIEAWWREWRPPVARDLNRRVDLFSADEGDVAAAASRYRSWRIEEVPTLVLVDGRGREIHRFVGLDEVAQAPGRIPALVDEPDAGPAPAPAGE